MTTVTLKYFRNSIYGIKLEGHAGFNTKGPDILCASLSMASQMVCNQVAKEAYALGYQVVYDIDDGYLNFELVNRKGCYSPRIETLFACLREGITNLQENPEFANYIETRKEYWNATV